MRFVLCGLSAVLLSGCSWLGGFGNSSSSSHYKYEGAAPQHAGAYHKRPQAYNPCVIYSPVQPVPAGCDPAKVTLANAPGHYGAQGQGGTYTTGGYGSHAANAGSTYYQGQRKMKKPRLRGSLSLGVEKSYSGTFLDPAISPGVDVASLYNPDDFAEGFIDGSIADGFTETTTYSAIVEDVVNNPKAFDDAYHLPARTALGLEYIVSPNFTLFANAGYTTAEGTDNAAAIIVAEQTKTITGQNWDPATGNPVGPPVVDGEFIPNQEIAYFSYDYSDLRKYDFELGARHYFDPIVKNEGFRTLTPFVGASAGISHVNAASYKIGQQQLFFAEAFERNPEGRAFYDVPYPDTTVEVYDSAWLPKGTLTAGMEWQLTPKTALALETGVKYEKSRDYVNGANGDDNISVPVTLRGSFNF